MLLKSLRGHKARDSQVTERRPAPAGEQGYMLLGAIVAVALVMIALSVAVTVEAFALRREREEESVRRANQYVRAIREYYLKFQHYPASIEQLENTNNIRFLRQRYIDPLTGKADYRLILVGQNKTTVKGFFGEPLSGLPGAGPGAAGGAPGTSAAGTSATGAAGVGAAGAGAGASAGIGLGFGSGSGSGGTATAAGGATNGAPQGTAANGANGTTTQDTGGGSSLSGSGPPGSNGPFMGVGSSATGNSTITVNEQTTYQTWEFLYDPRIERLKAAAALNSGGGSGSPLGQNPVGTSSVPASSTGAPGATSGNGGTTPAGVGQPTQP